MVVKKMHARIQLLLELASRLNYEDFSRQKNSVV